MGKRPGGLELIDKGKEYWKAHLVTSPKKDDLVFKHVRGDGNHFVEELNGVKEMVCSLGSSRLLFLKINKYSTFKYNEHSLDHHFFR